MDYIFQAVRFTFLLSSFIVCINADVEIFAPSVVRFHSWHPALCVFECLRSVRIINSFVRRLYFLQFSSGRIAVACDTRAPRPTNVPSTKHPAGWNVRMRFTFITCTHTHAHSLQTISTRLSTGNTAPIQIAGNNVHAYAASSRQRSERRIYLWHIWQNIYMVFTAKELACIIQEATSDTRIQ